MTRGFAKSLLGALLLLGVLPACAAPTAAPSPAETQCFQAQFLVRLPGLEAKQFVQAVAALNEQTGQNSADAAQHIMQLRQQADALRHAEGAAYARLTALLLQMGAPPSLHTWAATDDQKLSQPVTLTKDEQKEAQTDPNTADILATLDEATALKSDTDAQIPSLGEWVSLSYGPKGLWAADVGELTAALQVAVAGGQGPRLAVNLARHLRDSAPAGSPSAVLSALSLLIPPSGNLSDLVPTTVVIPLLTASQAHDTLLSIFQAQSLAVLIPAAAAPVPQASSPQK